ncbi:dnaJ homolog subfamily C member 28 [Takifugu rubripes]|uniref:DnaJ (Hsp40) homolog, subfamily C, member 28 n=1 Tax=Takifugu rubripes TaxID=31033 RepID=H2TEJ2_TAKRU|nr:dnaJ homolog subfamily C member 28 [Takifugu rubripes]
MSCLSHWLVPRGSIFHNQFLLVLSTQSCRVRIFSSRTQIKQSLRESYRLLQLPPEGNSSLAQVKEAYLPLAKLYHPDSGAPTANAELFAKVEEAYRTVLAHQRKTKQPHQEKTIEEEEKRHAALAHRHYLNYEGVGSGTPFQRESQYRQIRVDRAAEKVLNYRQREHERAAAAEGELVERDVRQRSHKIKITQAVERHVEDLIQESMARGDFRNLSGAGKPLTKFEHNPYADPMMHNLNRILVDNGYQPPWVVTQRDIRETIGHIRKRLLVGRIRLGNPMTPKEQSQWEELCASVQEDLVKLNKTVDNYNLIVPMLTMQMVHFSLSRELDRAVKGAHQYKMDQWREKEKDRERQKEEKKSANSAQNHKNSKHTLMYWIKNVFKLKH